MKKLRMNIECNKGRGYPISRYLEEFISQNDLFPLHFRILYYATQIPILANQVFQ